MALDSDNMAKLSSLLEENKTKKVNSPSKNEQEIINNHIHNDVCVTFDDAFRTFTGSCGYDSSLKWNEKKSDSIKKLGNQCVVCQEKATNFLILVPRKDIQKAIPEYDLLPVCEDHYLEIEKTWLSHEKEFSVSKDSIAYSKYKTAWVYREIIRLQLIIENKKFEQQLEKKDESYNLLIANLKNLSITKSPISLAEELGIQLTDIHRRAAFLNISWLDDASNLELKNYVRLRTSLEQIKESPIYLEYPDVEACVVCGGWLNDLNVIDDRFDSYLCSGHIPNWNINSLPDGSNKCWHDAKGIRQWKGQFGTATIAKAYMERDANSHNEDPKNYSIYKCTNCYHYHYGHNSRNKRKK